MSWQVEADISPRAQRGGWAVFWQSASVFLVMIAAGLAYLAFRRVLDERLLFALTGAYAGIGVFFLACAVYGFRLRDPLKALPVHMLDHLPQALVLTSGGGRVLYENAVYRRLTGSHRMTPEILLARDEAATQAMYRLSLAARQERAACEEIKLAKSLLFCNDNAAKTGSFVYSVAVKPFQLDGCVMVMWTVADLTEQRAGQEILTTDPRGVMNHLDHAPAGFMSWDGKGRIVYLNAILARWLGIDFSTFTPRKVLLSDLIGEQNMEELRRRLEHNGDVRGMLMPLGLAGREKQSRSLRLHIGAATQDEDLARAVVLQDDSVENVSPSEKAIATGLASLYLDEYFGVSPVALAIIKRNGLMERFNERFRELFNLAQTAATDPVDGRQNLVCVFEAQDQSRVAEAMRQAFSSMDARVAPIDAVMMGDRKRYIRLYISPVGREWASCGAIVISAVETTEQRALEQQMEQSQKMQAVGQLAGGIAHDFNNVLTAIIMSCDLLLGSHRSSDPSHPDIMNIKHNASRAASLVRQLLAFSRRQTLRPEVLDLTDMLADLRMLVARLVGNSIQLHIEHGRSLWPVKADQAELERVIMNLAANSRDAMPGGGRLVIRTGNLTEQESRQLDYQGFSPADYVLIEVCDTGSGIAPEILEKIFDPFFTTKEVGKGTGLGLSTVYGIVTQTGGYIHCHSRPGEGTCFRIYLPRHFEEAACSIKEQVKHNGIEKKTEDSRPVDLSGSANVLLVEDEDAVRMGGVKALQSRGYTVFEAASGIEALKVIKEQKGKIDIVVSDVVMPEMDGPTLLKELRKMFPQIKFIFVSGYAQDAFAKNLPEEGAAFAFLAKPFSLKQLATAVKEMLHNNDG